MGAFWSRLLEEFEKIVTFVELFFDYETDSICNFVVGSIANHAPLRPQ